MIEKRREIDKKRCLGKVMKEMDARKIVKVERSPEKVIWKWWFRREGKFKLPSDYKMTEGKVMNKGGRKIWNY